MAAKGEAFELTGIVRLIADRRIVAFDQESSDRLPSRGQVAVELSGACDTVTVVLDPDGRKGHWLSIDGSGPVDIDAEPGSKLAFTAQLCGSWPETEVPGDLSAALKDTPELDGTWAGLTPCLSASAETTGLSRSCPLPNGEYASTAMDDRWQ